MASFVYTYALAKLLSADLDLNGHDIRYALLMTNTTADTEEDKQTISGFTTLDEMDGASYARQALTSEAVNTDTSNNRGEFDADDVAFATLGNGTRQVEGGLLYRHITNDSDAVPIAFHDFTNFNPGGATINVQWDAEGIIQAANA